MAILCGDNSDIILKKKDSYSENKTELSDVLLRDGTVDKLVVLGKQPNIVCQRKMREYPQRIDCNTTIIIQCQLV